MSDAPVATSDDPRQAVSRYLVAGIGKAVAVAVTIVVLSILVRGT